jgi:hypothetical protein
MLLCNSEHHSVSWGNFQWLKQFLLSLFLPQVVLHKTFSNSVSLKVLMLMCVCVCVCVLFQSEKRIPVNDFREDKMMRNNNKQEEGQGHSLKSPSFRMCG